MAKTKKDTLALFEVIHSAKGTDPSLKVPPRPRPGDLSPMAAPVARTGVWFRLTRAHVLITLMIVCLIAGVAYFAGSHKTRAPQYSRTSDEIRKDVPNSLAMEPQGTIAEAPPLTPAEAGSGGPAVATPADGRRINGYTYIIVQSYPTQEAATEIRDYLTRAGIPCTVEKNHPYAPRWYCVITSAGFPRASSREYEECVKSIRAASVKYPGPKFMKSEPQPYKWR